MSAEEKKASRKARKAALTREINKTNRLIAEDEIEQAKAQLPIIKDKFSQFEKIHDEYHAMLEETEMEDSQDYFDETESRYVEALTKIKRCLTSYEDVKQEKGSKVELSGSDWKQGELLSIINMPKVELEVFNGDPLQFHTFFAIFDEHVHCSRQDPSAKLTRLIQYTSGPAREAIRNCVLVGGAQGYKQAREILLKRFGDDHLIFDRIVSSLRTGKTAKSNFELQALADELCNCKSILDKMNRLSEIDNQSFILDVANRLPNYIKNRWKRHALDFKEEKSKYPGLEEFVKFVGRESNNANDPVYGNSGPNVRSSFAKSSSSSFSTNLRLTSESLRSASPRLSFKQYPCKACGEEHRLFACQVFKEMKPHERLKFVTDHKLCENCLLSNHLVSNCRKPTTCSVPGCGQKHTKFIHVSHPTRKEKDSSSDNHPKSEVSNVRNVNVNAGGNSNKIMHVPTVLVNVNDRVNALALLDTASTTTFCTKRLANSLNLKGRAVSFNLSTLSATSESKTTEQVELYLKSVDGSEFMKLSCVYLVDEIPANVPNVDLMEYPYLSDLPLNNSHASVDILIGQDHSEALLPLQCRKGKSGEPFAVKTLFGWSLNGPITCQGSVSKQIVSHFITSSTIEENVERLWVMENEDLAQDKLSWSVEDNQVVGLWDKEVKLENGHYTLPIPWKKDLVMPNNISVAISRLRSLKLSLDKRGLTPRYHSELTKLVEKGYAERVPRSELLKPDKVWYLPHQAVVSEKKPDKLRIVFDCASKYAGQSLNDKCLQGPDLNNKLIHVLLKFRLYEYVVMADVESMYYQIRVPEYDRNCLRFLWYDGNGEIEQFRMTSHVFGGVWCASVATYAMRRVIQDFGGDAEVVNTIMNSFYVDDCLRSFPSREHAELVIHGTRSLLQKGGFNLTKIVTNDEILLSQFSESDRAGEVKDFAPGCNSKALGVKWSPVHDFMYFEVKVNEADMVTRRSILRIVSSMFDPLGLISPVLIIGRILFQDVTRLKYSWDDVVCEDLAQDWFRWLKSLCSLNEIKITRCVIPREFVDAYFDLQHFSDASERAYGVCSYLRCINKEGKIHVALLCSKAKVTPIKSVSIPRLELQAAVLAVRVDVMLRSELGLELGESRFWVDSMIVLQYIQSQGQRFHVYVANRVGEIHRQTKPSQWSHISGLENPADVITRGQTPESLMCSSWFSGPAFLYKYKCDWDAKLPLEPLSNEDPELKSEKFKKFTGGESMSCVTDVRLHPIDALINQFSSFYKVKRAVAWWLKLVAILRSKNKESAGDLTVEDMNIAEVLIVKRVQILYYEKEVAQLSAGEVVGKHSSIRSLSPILNSDGVICVGGRIKYADLDVTRKHPFIIPHGHKVATMIVEELHGRAHLGVEWTLSLLRKKFWLTKARVIIKRVKRLCVICKKLYAMPCTQKMADLPEERLIAGLPPFSYIGLDCFGPFAVSLGRSVVKRYGCIFTCLNTRAIHIEKLDSLDTQSFINGLRRFVSRRGQPIKIWCDNGTNFVGAHSELSRELCKVDGKKVKSFASKQSIEWSFNPPHASHWGGVWERLIRTIRKVLSAVLSNVRLTDEILQTVLVEVEGIVNSRPITKVSDQSDDPVALTPNHLLLLREGPPPPPGVFEHVHMYGKRWKYIQHLANQFWQRWRREYIPELVKRNKWFDVQRNLKIGDLVLLVDENTPRGLWPLAIVTEVFHGRDDLIRSVKVKTKSSVFVRPISKVVLIEGC